MAYNGFPSRPCACWINCNVSYPIFPIISSSLDARKTSSTIIFFKKKTVVRDYYSFFPSHSRCTLSIPPIKGLVGMETHTQKKVRVATDRSYRNRSRDVAICLGWGARRLEGWLDDARGKRQYHGPENFCSTNLLSSYKASSHPLHIFRILCIIDLIPLNNVCWKK